MILEDKRIRWQEEQEEKDRKFRADEVEKGDIRHKENLKLTADLYAKGQKGEWWRLLAALVVGVLIATVVPKLLGTQSPNLPAASQK